MFCKAAISLTLYHIRRSSTLRKYHVLVCDTLQTKKALSASTPLNILACMSFAALAEDFLIAKLSFDTWNDRLALTFDTDSAEKLIDKINVKVRHAYALCVVPFVTSVLKYTWTFSLEWPLTKYQVFPDGTFNDDNTFLVCTYFNTACGSGLTDYLCCLDS